MLFGFFIVKKTFNFSYETFLVFDGPFGLILKLIPTIVLWVLRTFSSEFLKNKIGIQSYQKSSLVPFSLHTTKHNF